MIQTAETLDDVTGPPRRIFRDQIASRARPGRRGGHSIPLSNGQFTRVPSLRGWDWNPRQTD